MADKKNKTDAETTEEAEAATPAVDEGEPVAAVSDDAPADEAEAEPAEAVPTDEPVAGDDTTEQPAVEPEPEPVAEEPVAEEPAAEAEPEPEPEPEPVAEAAPEPAAEEPAAEEPPADARAAEAETEAPPAGEPPQKKKRLPRALRRQRTKPKREQPADRKPIVRLPKPEGERGRRQERRGVVVSAAMDKTIVVKVETIRAHPKYKKVVRRSTKLHAHDEANTAKAGDIVRIVESRPLSKTKNWRLAEVVEEAK